MRPTRRGPPDLKSCGFGLGGNTGARPVAVVTGASGGVGRATAVALADAGFDVGLVARGAAGLNGASEEVSAHGGRSHVVSADVARFEEVDKAAEEIEEALGPIELWVNDAMATVFAPLSEIEPADFARAVEVTFLGQVWGTMTALKRMRQRDHGTIVNVGSALCFMGIPLQSPYCAAKFACRGFFESARAELLHDKSSVRMAMVHLPAVNTPQFDWSETSFDHHPQPVPPIYQPEIPARRIVETALNGGPETVVGSWNKALVVVGRLAPRFGNHYAALGAWQSQLTSERIDPDRPSNLRQPIDEKKDHGAHGSFDDKAHGVKSPSFLESLPQSGVVFAKALRATAEEKLDRLRAQMDRLV